jgi:hypothetical protein
MTVSEAVAARATTMVKEFHESSHAADDGDAAAVASVARCLVYCRVRPSNAKDYEDGGFQLISVSGKRVFVKDERHYDFDGTFGQDSRQEQVFESIAVPCLQHAIAGYCSALMCYGQTGTGKSFTMCCTKPECEGIIPRSARYLFENLYKDTSKKYTVSGQFIQIYRDQLGDLMVNTGRDKVDIRFEAATGVTLPGCSSHELTSAESFMAFYNEGNTRRVVTATAMNPESSRGHSAMVIWITSVPTDETSCSGQTRGKITFIDLAGYERFSKTGISNSNPIMKDEAKTINASLLSLGHVVSSLSNGDKHIPWRNSKLTRLLQDSIGGRSRTSIILTVGPSSESLHESTNSLQFGMRAMAVKVEAKISVNMDYEKLAAKLQGLLNERDARISVLELQLASRDAEREELLERHQRDDQNLHLQFKKDIEELQTSGASAEEMQQRTEAYEKELQALREQHKEEVEYQQEVYSKEIVTLVAEQEKQERLRTTEVKLAQERIMEEFQNKLESARGGTNEDLVKAIRQLAEKDAVIASRANDTARLHERIQSLVAQLRELGKSPESDSNFPETFLDVSQVSEIQARLDSEIERQHAKIVEVRAQLDKVSSVCNERLERIDELERQLAVAKSHLIEVGMEAEAATEQLTQMEQDKKRLIDPLEFETVRESMQADINELKAHNEDLQLQLEKAKEAAAAAQRTTRARGASMMGAASRMSIRPPVESDHPASEAISKFRETIISLEQNLLRSENEKQALREQLKETATLLPPGTELPSAKHVDPTAGPTSQVLNDSNLSDGASPGSSRAFSLPGPNSSSTTSELLLHSKNTEVEAMMELLSKQEDLLAAERRQRKVADETVTALTNQLLEQGLTPVAVIPTSTSGVVTMDMSMEHVNQIIRKMRTANAPLLKKIVADIGLDGDDFDSLLREKEIELQQRDEVILEKSAQCTYLIQLFGKLEAQLESLGFEPDCRLTHDLQAALDSEVKKTQGQLDELKRQQTALEEDLKREADEKARMKSVLMALNRDRALESNVTASYKVKLEEDLREAKVRAEALQQKEERNQLAFSEILREKMEKEAVLEDQVRRATREMMAMQARMVQKEDSGIFSSLLKKFSKHNVKDAQ